MVSLDTPLPTLEELTVPEIKLTTAPLLAASLHLGKCCDQESKEFMLCHFETRDPRKCVDEGKAVTACGLNFFRSVKKHCAPEFEKLTSCVFVHGNEHFSLQKCRSIYNTFSQCMSTKLNIEQPEKNFFNHTRLHATDAPRRDPAVAPMPERIPDLPNFHEYEDHEHLDKRCKVNELILN